MPVRQSLLSAFSEVVDAQRRWTPDWYSWVAGITARFGGGVIATNATDGFFYIPTCAGPPTGTPIAQDGRAAMVIDTTNNKLYFYSGGAWRDAGP